MLNIQALNEPRKYLGPPTQRGRSTAAFLSSIKDSILGKMDGWKEKLLNSARKEILIKLVIQAMPMYAMSVLKLPKKFCEAICLGIA